MSWRLITLQYCSGFCHALTLNEAFDTVAMSTDGFGFPFPCTVISINVIKLFKYCVGKQNF